MIVEWTKRKLQMKKIRCYSCSKSWYVDDMELNSVNTCPFCSITIRKKSDIGAIDTLGKALYKAVSDYGLDVLTNNDTLLGYLSDIIPELKKEVRIFSRVFQHDYAEMYLSVFKKDIDETSVVINKLKDLFVEEDGLSEVTANLLCENCKMAVLYYKGDSLPDIFSADIEEARIEKSNLIKESTEQCDTTIEYTSFPTPIANLKKTEIQQHSHESLNYRVGRGMKFGHHKNGDPMRWRILAIDDNLALLHYTGSDIERGFQEEELALPPAALPLDCQINLDIIWKDCSLRQWLNNDFIEKHFTRDEKNLLFNAIIETDGVYTQDKMFCLSIEETRKYGAYIKDSYYKWLLRNKGKTRGTVVTYERGIYNINNINIEERAVVRPAMYISTSYFTK